MMHSNTRPFGQRSGFEVPPANIGAMRLPQDTDDAIALIRKAIDAGMRYIDTSRGYGESEWIVGRALKDGYRDKVILSTKCSPWIKKVRADDAPTADSTRRRIEESMRRLDVDYLDFYQVWNIDCREHYDAAVAEGGMVEGIQKAMQEGLVGHTGFTTHDSPENVIDYLQEADWCEVVLFSFNLLKRMYGPAIRAAHEQGIGTIIMNPVGGGKLAAESPVFKRLADQVGAASVDELALRYVISQPWVTTMINGLSKPADVDNSIAAVQKPTFTEGQLEEIEQFLDGLAKENVGFCTACGYCLPCPQGIDIPTVLDCVYQDRFLGLKEHARRRYQGLKGPGAEVCTACGQCVDKCTQGLNVIEQMRYAREEYESTPSDG